MTELIALLLVIRLLTPNPIPGSFLCDLQSITLVLSLCAASILVFSRVLHQPFTMEIKQSTFKSNKLLIMQWHELNKVTIEWMIGKYHNKFAKLENWKIDPQKNIIPWLRRLLIRPATDGKEVCLNVAVTWKNMWIDHAHYKERRIWISRGHPQEITLQI